MAKISYKKVKRQLKNIYKLQLRKMLSLPIMESATGNKKDNFNKSIKKMIKRGFGEMAHQLKAFAAFPEGLG